MRACIPLLGSGGGAGLGSFASGGGMVDEVDGPEVGDKGTWPKRCPEHGVAAVRVPSPPAGVGRGGVVTDALGGIRRVGDIDRNGRWRNEIK